MVSIELKGKTSHLLQDRWEVAGIIRPLNRDGCVAGLKISSALDALEGE